MPLQSKILGKSEDIFGKFVETDIFIVHNQSLLTFKPVKYKLIIVKYIKYSSYYNTYNR